MALPIVRGASMPAGTAPSPSPSPSQQAAVIYGTSNCQGCQYAGTAPPNPPSPLRSQQAAFGNIRRDQTQNSLQHTSVYVSIHQHTSAYVSISIRRQYSERSNPKFAAAYVSIRQHTSAYVSIRQHTSAKFGEIKPELRDSAAN
jgi:hypothetical protein